MSKAKAPTLPDRTTMIENCATASALGYADSRIGIAMEANTTKVAITTMAIIMHRILARIIRLTPKARVKPGFERDGREKRYARPG